MENTSAEQHKSDRAVGAHSDWPLTAEGHQDKQICPCGNCEIEDDLAEQTQQKIAEPLQKHTVRLDAHCKEKNENYSPIVCKYLKSIYLCKRK